MAQNSDFFFLRKSMSAIQPSRKRNKNDVEILDFGHPTYSVNTLKFEYLGLCTPRVVHSLNLVVW